MQGAREICILENSDQSIMCLHLFVNTEQNIYVAYMTIYVTSAST